MRYTPSGHRSPASILRGEGGLRWNTTKYGTVKGGLFWRLLRSLSITFPWWRDERYCQRFQIPGEAKAGETIRITYTIRTAEQ